MTLNWRNPYPSARSPVFARNVVATSQPLATSAGVEAMRRGGNAVDAALAAAITLTVVEPCNNGIGSDAFAIVHHDGELTGLNASGRSPAGWTPERFAGDTSMPLHGWETVTVPGCVSAWVALSGRYGKLDFADLFDAAIGYARDGFQLAPITGGLWAHAAERLGQFEGFRQTFLPDGIPAIGSTVYLPDHARSLEAIAASRGESFYRGELASAMVADSAAHGGALSMDDLAEHRAGWVTPISQTLNDTRLHEIPPSGQGLMALIAVAIVERLGIGDFALDSADSVHLQIEAARGAYAEIERHLADLDHMRVTPEELLDPQWIVTKADAVSMERANPRPTTLGASADTVYLTAASDDGTMVSLIQSNYMGFGSGVVVPGTGISMQNRGHGFTLEPGHPNQVGSRKRPYHTIIPGFVTREGSSGIDPLMSFGVMGGHMQAQGHLQMMVRVCLHGQNPQAANDAPRWYLHENGQVSLEPGFDAGVASELARRGHDVIIDEPAPLFGGAQLIYRLEDGYCAGSDSRKEGHAAGF